MATMMAEASPAPGKTPDVVLRAMYEQEHAKRIRADEIVETQKRVINALRDKIAYRDAIDACPKFGGDGNLRAFIAHMNDIEQQNTPQAEGPYKGLYRVPIKDLAAACGVDESNPGRKAKRLVEHGLMEYHVQEHYITQDGQNITICWGRLSPALKTVEGLGTLDNEPLTKQGGDHYICQKMINGKPCGGRIKRKRRVIEEQLIEICEACGDETVLPPQRINDSDRSLHMNTLLYIYNICEQSFVLPTLSRMEVKPQHEALEVAEIW